MYEPFLVKLTLGYFPFLHRNTPSNLNDSKIPKDSPIKISKQNMNAFLTPTHELTAGCQEKFRNAKKPPRKGIRYGDRGPHEQTSKASPLETWEMGWVMGGTAICCS
ncbi:hypothetical protein CEXT_163591 [Caerostris extrusa]|uniref:Uncharacterized protein n=1 Tax=Caerostris extrusa TaxID=172846 RepID=A0AAV4PSZ2_CAEEX|nr:hypothetical protein CEXT_163591 [Caerostris extrusa]